MENKNANESAFAFDQEKQTDYGDRYKEAHFGLTKREYFAAMAMQGILSNSNRPGPSIDIAILSVEHADELLKQLEKQ